MEEKWFAWFDEPVLHLHRSWTGTSIFQVRFNRDEGGWRAISAKVNRNPEQYSETDDNSDRRLITELINELLVNDPGRPGEDQFVEAMMQAAQPNYLGSPSVVSGLVQPVMEAAIAYFKGDTNFNAVWDLVWTMSQEIATGDEYVRMPGWHNPDALGKTLVKYMAVKPEDLFADDMDYFISESLMAVFMKARDLLRGFAIDPAAEWNPHALEQLNGLHEWTVQVFLGTNELANPGITINDFDWRPAGPPTAT